MSESNNAQAPITLEDLQNLEMAAVRAKRNSLIQETDWTQMPDVSIPDDKKVEFASYRQKLRDIPQKYSDPTEVAWPEKPTL